MKFLVNNILVFVVLAGGISACQSTRYYSLHFYDRESDVFYFSGESLINSIDTCIVIKDTLHIILSPPILMRESNGGYYIEYYKAYRKPDRKYTEKLIASDYPYNLNYSFIILDNYYCTRIFKRKNSRNYIQDSSFIFSSHLDVPKN